MRIPIPSDIGRRWRTILAIIIVIAASFTIGVFANRVIISNVSSLGGSIAPVPAPDFLVLGTGFVTDSSTGNVTDVNINATTTGSSSTLSFYHVVVQIKCLLADGSVRSCATGTQGVVLPENMMPPGSAGPRATWVIDVTLNHSLDPTSIEVDGLSIQVQETPFTGPFNPFCRPLFTFGKALSLLSLDPNTGNVVPTPPILLKYSTTLTETATPLSVLYFTMKLTSMCGFSDNITLTASISGSPSPTVSLFYLNNPLLNGGAVQLLGGSSIFPTESVAFPASMTGTVTVTINACSSTAVCHAVTQIFNVVPAPPPPN